MKSTLTLTFENGDELAKFVAGHFGSGQAPAAPVVDTAAPVVDTAAPVVDTAAPVVDSDGIPWDYRIHAPSKARNKDETWRKKKKLNSDFIASIEAELKSLSTPPMPVVDTAPVTPPMPAAPVTPPMPVVDTAPVTPPMPAAPVTPPMPAAPVTPPMPVVDTAPVTPPVMDFHTFMQHLSAQMQKRDDAGQPVVSADYLSKITGEISTAFQTPLSAITDIATRTDMIAYAVQLMQRDGKWD